MRPQTLAIGLVGTVERGRHGKAALAARTSAPRRASCPTCASGRSLAAPDRAPRTSASSRSPSSLVAAQPCATAVALSIRATSTSLPRDERPGERGRHRRAIGVDRAGLERGQRVVADELLADVDDVRANGAERQRALRTSTSSLPCAEVERHRDDFGLECLGQPRIAIEASSPPEYARTIRSMSSLRLHRIEREVARRSPSRRVADRQITRMVSSPPIVPAISGSRARSIATASDCACPGSVRSTSSCSIVSCVRRYSSTARRRRGLASAARAVSRQPGDTPRRRPA